ncbi:MAG: WYL domain-containing protein [Fibrobacter sp.]|nr:WYL domain-containing protein [Fibrobacter sp.]
MATSYQKINDLKAKLKTQMTVKQLAASLGCGTRTVFRHLNVIDEEHCGLRSFKRGNETYYVIQTEEETNFNQSVVKQLEKVKKSLSGSDASDLKSIKLLDSVIGELQKTNPMDFKPEAITLDPDYIVDHGPFSDNNVKDTMVNKVLKAIHDGFKIKITYHRSTTSDDTYTSEVTPVKVIMRMDTLYLIAADDKFEESQTFKNFVFGLITNVVVTNTPVAKIPFDPDLHYKYTFAKYTDAKMKPEEVSLEIKEQWLVTQFKKSHFNPEAQIRSGKNGTTIVDLKVRLTPDFYIWLLGVSTEVRILKPAHLKETIKNNLQKALAEMDA